MANGAVTDLFTNGRGKVTGLTVILLTLAGGQSWWFSNEARREMEANIAQATAVQERLVNNRFDYLTQRFEKLERDIAGTHGHIWAEIAKRPDRDSTEDRRREIDRRLEVIERRLDNLANMIYRG